MLSYAEAVPYPVVVCGDAPNIIVWTSTELPRASESPLWQLTEFDVISTCGLVVLVAYVLPVTDMAINIISNTIIVNFLFMEDHRFFCTDIYIDYLT